MPYNFQDGKFFPEIFLKIRWKPDFSYFHQGRTDKIIQEIKTDDP